VDRFESQFEIERLCEKTIIKSWAPNPRGNGPGHFFRSHPAMFTRTVGHRATKFGTRGKVFSSCGSTLKQGCCKLLPQISA